MIHPHPHLYLIFRNIKQYREGKIDSTGLQLNLLAVEGALEGDIPQIIRDKVREAESSADNVAWAGGDRQEAEVVFDELERLILTECPPPGTSQEGNR